MKQNKYDDAAFFAKYGKMPRSLHGLDGAAEWPVFRSLLPALRGKRVLDLGCGYGWHSRYFSEQGAVMVVAIDLSEKMLAEARARSADRNIEYRRCAIEDINLAEGEFDIVFSSLALHYVENFPVVSRAVYRSLSPGGSFVFSVEHPILTALAAQDWHLGAAGERLHWPVDDYQEEGRRQTRWLGEDVVKYHRTIATYFNSLIDAGFRISNVIEPSPSAEMRAQRPDLKDEHRRPAFLLIAAAKAE